MNHFVYTMPMGRLTIAADDLGITEIHFGDITLDMNYQPSALTNQAATQLQEYFTGNRTEFSVPIHASGTDFQLLVWNAISHIPYGQTCSYADIAQAIGKPTSYRAVGNAANKNPIPIIIPCHRVIKSQGVLGEYAFGNKIKEYLLELEAGKKTRCPLRWAHDRTKGR